MANDRRRASLGLPAGEGKQSLPVVARRQCTVVLADGRPCRAGPLRDRPYCFAHDPERADEAARARRLGGLRRRREGTIAIAYDLPGLDSVAGIRRVLEIVVADALGLEVGIARLRILIAAAAVAAKLLETGEPDDRSRAILAEPAGGPLLLSEGPRPDEAA
jgi:hypothetical protein